MGQAMRNSRLIKKLALALLALTLIVAAGLIRLDALNQKPSDPAHFSWLNKAEVYTLGVVMSVLAYPIYPEVAREHLSLYVPNNGEPKRYSDDFFLKSSVVRDAINKATQTNIEVRLYWSVNDYRLSLNPEDYWEARVALAFNGGWLRVEGKQAVARIPIAYPKRALAPLISIPGIGTLAVQEGLFWVLQQEGWYHVGEVEWVADIPNVM